MIKRMVGKKALYFEMKAWLADKSFGQVSLQENMEREKWTVLLFCPMDFAIVCPTEITAVSGRYNEFKELDAEVIGISTDSVYTHLAWVNTEQLKMVLEN